MVRYLSMAHLRNEEMAGSERKGLLPDLNLLPDSNLSPLQTVGLSSEKPPTPTTSPTDTTATSTNGVGDQPIPSLSAVSGLDLNNDPPHSPTPVPPRRPKFKLPFGFSLILGKLHPQPSILQSRMPPPPPTDTAATSIRSVANLPIPAASAVNDPQHNVNPRQPPASGTKARKRPRQPPASGPKARKRPRQPSASGPKARKRPRRNGTVLDPERIGICENQGFYESNLWFPDVLIPGRSKPGLQIYLGNFCTKQEAQDVHDRAALKLFKTKGVEPVLNSDESCHAKFMEDYKDWDLRDFLWQFRRSSAHFARGKSSMKGVTVITRAKGNLFQAKAAYTYSQEEGGKVFYEFGRFASEEDAGKAYDRGVLFLRHEETEEQKLNVSTNFRPSTYSDSEILKAGKDFNIRKPILPSRIA